MAVTIFHPNSFATKLGTASINLSTDTFKVMLLANTYTFDTDAHAARSDVSSHEVTGTGYTAGGIALGSNTWTQDNSNNRTAFDAADPSFATVTLTARYAVVYKNSGTAATDWIVAVINFGADQVIAGINFELTLNAAGLFVVRQEPAF